MIFAFVEKFIQENISILSFVLCSHLPLGFGSLHYTIFLVTAEQIPEIYIKLYFYDTPYIF